VGSIGAEVSGAGGVTTSWLESCKGPSIGRCFRPTLEPLVVPRPSPGVWEQHLWLDKAYDSAEIRLSTKRRSYIAHIPHRGQPPVSRKPGQPARRWVIERANRWQNLFRRLRIRHDVHSQNYRGFVELASAIICFRRARHETGSRTHS